MFSDDRPYAVLNGPDDSGGSDCDGTKNDVGDSSNVHGKTPQRAATPNVGSWRLGPDLRLRRLRRVDVRDLPKKNRDVAHGVFNGPRVVFAPYAVVPPL
jgi:hypothetical protein